LQGEWFGAIPTKLTSTTKLPIKGRWIKLSMSTSLSVPTMKETPTWYRAFAAAKQILNTGFRSILENTVKVGSKNTPFANIVLIKLLKFGHLIEKVVGQC
jgi:hypothetical protein